ncbi:MAG: hypothetical protein ISS34_03970 [Candidatus Omnitrophica bacterium]|nr:hypothetical protein [Candidatus Omnitrophota bacterium]
MISINKEPRFGLKSNWSAALELLAARPIVLMPFLVLALIQGLFLELLYFSSRRPLSFIADPLIRKFFGAGFTHYPAELILLPKLFAYASTLIYITAGIFLTAVCVEIIKRAKEDSSFDTGDIIRDNGKRYTTFLIYGVIATLAVYLAKRGNAFVFSLFYKLLASRLPEAVPGTVPAATTFFMPMALFLTIVVLHVFLLLVIPIIVIRGGTLWKAIVKSVSMGLRNFSYIFPLIIVPYLVYLPVFIMKANSARLAKLVFPEVILIITAAGIIVSMFVDCFVVICATEFLLKTTKKDS